MNELEHTQEYNTIVQMLFQMLVQLNISIYAQNSLTSKEKQSQQ